MMNDNEKLDRLIHLLSERTGTPESELRGAVRSADLNKLLSRMDPAQAQRARELLGDQQSAEQFLKSPQARAILKRLMN